MKIGDETQIKVEYKVEIKIEDMWILTPHTFEKLKDAVTYKNRNPKKYRVIRLATQKEVMDV